MASPIDKKTLAHLAELARIELDPKEEERLVKDLQRILDYFEELKALDTTGVKPMTGGAERLNVFREDNARENTNQGKGTDVFPESKDGYNKVPPVF